MRILAIGDSNTYGTDPDVQGGRYPEKLSWPAILGSELSCEVINLGISGAPVPFTTGEILSHCKRITHKQPADLAIILLGENNLIEGEPTEGRVPSSGLSPEATAFRMRRYLRHLHTKYPEMKLLLVSLPKVDPMLPIADKEQKALPEKVEKLASLYAEIAAEIGISFADAWQWDLLPYGKDHAHYTTEAHSLFAKQLLPYVKDILYLSDS